MKFALLDCKKIEAAPNLVAVCPSCGGAVRSYCGEQVVHHWKHINLSDCDSWYEPETVWHRGWKNQFDQTYQEIVRHDPITKEKHIADIYNPNKNVVLEFQHSPIEIEEIRARESFYDRMIWVIDLSSYKSNIEFHSSKTDIEYLLGKMRNNLPKDFKMKEDYQMNDTQSQVGDFFDMIGLSNLNTTKNLYILELQQKYKSLCENNNHYLMTWKYLHKRWNESTKPKFIDLEDNLIYQLVEKVEIGNAWIIKKHDKQKFIKYYQ